MPREVKEWIGKTPDSKCPPAVALRIFERYDRRCHISGTKIGEGDKWELEHIVPLEAGGENRESNLAPALPAWHKVKTKAEAATRAKRNNALKRRYGITGPKHIIPGSKASGQKHHMNGMITCRKTGRVLKEPRP